MHASLPRRVDPWRAGAAARRLAGELDRDRLPRLAALAALCGPLRVGVDFSQPAGTLQDVVHVAVRAEGRYRFTCQRCLQPMELDWPVVAQVLLAAEDGIARELERAADVVVSPPGVLLDLAALVEDEVMLALPFAPCHGAGQCAAQAAPGPAEEIASREGDRVQRADGARENPFAVLAALRRRPRDD